MKDCFPDHRVRQSYLPVYGHIKVSRSNHEYVNCIIQKDCSERFNLMNAIDYPSKSVIGGMARLPSN